MSVTAAEIIAYGSATMADDDVTTQVGGAIDTAKRVVFTDITPSGTVEVVSSAAGDTTQTLTVTYRDVGGAIQTEAKTLNGTTVVAFTATMERILKAVLSATATGTVTLRKTSAAGDLCVFAPGETQIRRVFYNASADVAGGSARDFYDKIFFKNTNGTTTLTAATIAEQADPSGNVTFALESTLDGTDTNGAGNNRQTVGSLSGYTFDSTTKNVANSQNLTAGSAQGCWLKLDLAAGDAAQKTSVTMRVAGSTT